MQKVQFKEEDVAKQRGSEFLYERPCGRSGTACSDNVVQHQNLLARPHSVCLHLEVICSILFLKASCLCRSRQLALFPHWYEACVESQRQGGTEEKAARVKTDDDVGFVLGAVCLFNMYLQGADECFVEGWICKDGEDVFE